MSDKKIEDFPCLENDFSTFDLRVCVLPDGHEGEHEFVDGDELLVCIDTTGVKFEVEQQSVN